MFTIMGKKQSDHTAKLHVQIFKKEKEKISCQKGGLLWEGQGRRLFTAATHPSRAWIFNRVYFSSLNKDSK